jgi:(p)ppGpp synthase/HD superfamily hydrolase
MGTYCLLDQALSLAAKAHKDQVRKGTDIPYISHPYAVGLILQKAGCREEVVVSGILHDLLEDTEVTLDRIQEEFGAEIAAIVEGCSEPGHDELSWETRKEHTIAYLKTAPAEVRLVACADKLHNVRSMLVDYQKVGEDLWQRFKRGREQQGKYYRDLVASLGEQMDSLEFGRIYLQFEAVVRELFG